MTQDTVSIIKPNVLTSFAFRFNDPKYFNPSTVYDQKADPMPCGDL